MHILCVRIGKRDSQAKLSCLVFPSLYGGPKKANHSYSWQIHAGLASEGMMSPFRRNLALEWPCHSDWSHNYKHPHSICYTRVFIKMACGLWWILKKTSQLHRHISQYRNVSRNLHRFLPKSIVGGFGEPSLPRARSSVPMSLHTIPTIQYGFHT